MSHYDEDPWGDLQRAETEDLRAELDVLKAQNEKLANEIKSAKAAQDPEVAKLAQLAGELGEDVETVRAKVAAFRAASTAPSAPDPDRLSELLEGLDPNDHAGVARAFDQAGFVREDALGQRWVNGRMQRPGMPQGAPEEIYRFLDTATSLEDYEAKLRQVGLLEGGVA